VKALLDSGATGIFIDKATVELNGIQTRRLARPIPVFNVDGTMNSSRSIEEEVEMWMIYKGHKEKVVMEVCDLGKTPLIVGFTWLQYHNPNIDWTTGEVHMSRCPPGCNVDRKKSKWQKKKIRKLFKYEAS